jgi:hypothetical protein
VRDLLGIARALYAADHKRGAGAGRLAEIAAAGKDLADALELARMTEPDTVGHRAACGSKLSAGSSGLRMS